MVLINGTKTPEKEKGGLVLSYVSHVPVQWNTGTGHNLGLF